VRQPNLPTRLFGNPASAIALLVAAGFCIYEWWSGQGSGGLALIAFLAAGYAMAASERLEKYKQWKREWEAMEGNRPAPTAARPLTALRAVLALAVWCFFAFLALSQANQPDAQLGVGLFWLATAVIVVAGIASLFRKRRNTRTRVVTDIPVTLCVPIPRNSPSAAQAFAALPQYCRLSASGA
jgi:hypothetical protein